MKTNFKNLIKIVIVTLVLASCAEKGFQLSLNEEFNGAKAFVEKDLLSVSTGEITRTWKLTETGLLSQSFKTGAEGIEMQKSQFSSDWNLQGIISRNAKGTLKSLSAKKANDEGFTSDYLEVNVEFEYKEQGVALLYQIWVYPNATGLRTQLFVKKLKNYTGVENSIEESTAEFLPVKTAGITTKLIGYNNDTQHRNTRKDEILKEKTTQSNINGNWASVVDLNAGGNGVIMVQESHKCANQLGVNTGAFNINEKGVFASGIGIGKGNLTSEYRPLWGYWTIGYKGNESDGQLALKKFDRMRYPINPALDIYIMANNWGSGSSGEESKYASREANTLIEIKSQKDLGIDLQQVDDGWQGHQYNTWDYVAKTKSRDEKYGTYDVYPEGWKNIKNMASSEGIRLGLWAAWTIPEKDLLKHYKTGGFTSYKLDFAKLKNYEIFHKFVNKVRSFVKKTDHNVRVNWDVTENEPRIGYYFGREYGNIYLENRKPMNPLNVLYHPYLVLRDAWQVSKYTNLNKFQVSIQNIDKVNKKDSDAYLHNHPYSVAIALMGSPIFFQETHYYTAKARAQIKPVVAVYKKHRNEMYKGFVFPIGEKPDNASWSGFQNYNSKTNTGYLTIFREINNKEKKHVMKLHFLKNKTLKLTNLMTAKVSSIEVNTDGEIQFEIENPVDFRFYKYEIK